MKKIIAMLVVLCSMALCLLSCGGAQNNNVTEDTNADNMPLRVEITTNEGKHHSSEYTYDANGNWITKNATLMGEQFYTYEYTYDAHGNITKNVYTDMYGVVKTRGTEFKLVYTSKDVTERTAKVLEFDYL